MREYGTKCGGSWVAAATASARCDVAGVGGACVTVAARAAPAQGDVRYGGNSDGQGRRGQVVRGMPGCSQCRTIGG